MWRISEQRGCMKRVNFVCKFFLEKHYYVFLFCVDDNVETRAGHLKVSGRSS